MTRPTEQHTFPRLMRKWRWYFAEYLLGVVIDLIPKPLDDGGRDLLSSLARWFDRQSERLRNGEV